MTFFLSSNENHDENTRTSFKNILPRDFLHDHSDQMYISLKKIKFDLNFPTVAKRNTPHIVTIITENEINYTDLAEFPHFLRHSDVFRSLHATCNSEIEWAGHGLEIEVDELEYSDGFKEIELFYSCDVVLGCVCILTYFDDLRLGNDKQTLIKILNGVYKIFQSTIPFTLNSDGVCVVSFEYNTFIKNH